MNFTSIKRISVRALLAGLLFFISTPAHAHCDTMDGPVITAARQALKTGNVNLALVWVQPGDEPAIREEFNRAREARQAGGEYQEEAERRFFEAFVRIHRAGEGAPYTGIKPAGTAINPGVRAVDRALETGSVDQVRQLLMDEVQSGLQRLFHSVMDLRSYDPNDVSAGRAYVKAYVDYTHFVEGIYQAATASAHHQHGATEEHAQRSEHGVGHDDH